MMVPCLKQGFIPVVGLLLSAAACTGSPASPLQVRFAKVQCPPEVSAGTVPGGTVGCVYVTVPERHGDPGGATIRVFVARFTPPGQLPPDPVLVIGGKDLGAPVAYADDIAVLQKRVGREVIVTEPRGTGHDQPSLACPEVDRVDTRFAGASLIQRELHDALATAVTACRKRLLGAGVDPSAFSLAESAADVVDVRDALHLSSFDIGTYGYNSKIAFAFLRRSPRGARSVFMDSPLYPGQGIFDVAIGATRGSLRALASACTRQRACRKALPNLMDTFNHVVARAQASPSSVSAIPLTSSAPVSATIDGTTIARAVRDFLSFNPASVPAVIAALAKGKPSDVAQYEAGSRPTCFGYRPRCKDGGASMATGEVLSILCHDEAPLSSTGSLAAAGAQAPGLAGAFAQNPWLGLCASWPVGRASPAERAAVRTGVPIVLLRGEFDPYTTTPDPAWLATMSHAYAYTFLGASYSPVAEGTSGCAPAIRAAFLDHPTRAPGPACINSLQEPSLVPWGSS